MKKKLTVTIGIPAYNEEANIQTLLANLLNQKEDSFKLEKIIVVCDGSTDSTCKKVLSFQDKKIVLVQNKKRLGQIYCQNLLFKSAKSDTVVLVEADTILMGTTYLEKLLQPIFRDTTIGLVEGYCKPLSPKALLEKILNAQFVSYRNAIAHNPNVDDWLVAGRGGKALTKKVYKNFVWPPNVPEDVYIHIWCQANKFKTKLVHSASTYYRLPQAINDAVRERRKIMSGRDAIKDYFSQELVDKYYKRPSSIKIKAFVLFMINNPLYCLFYLGLKIVLTMKASSTDFTDLWPMNSSTKILYKYEK